MKTKSATKLDSQETKENIKNTRNVLKVLQNTAANKENLAGRILGDKDKLASSSFKSEFKRKVETQEKAVQTGECVITAKDLTEEPGVDYWKKLAETRQDQLDDSFKENERLKEAIEALQEENKLYKEELEESRSLVEVLQELYENSQNDSTATELAEEATEAN